jgi:TatD DNase family protein
MKLVDAHVHLSDKGYEGAIGMVIEDAKAANAVALVTNAMDYESSIEALKIRESHPHLVYVALGIHPWNVKFLKLGELEQVTALIEAEHKKGTVVAIGEIGLDCNYEATWEEQLLVFDKMLRLAEKLELPVIIHSRGTTEFIVDMLPSYNQKRVLLHWFSHPTTALQKAIQHNYYITEGPPVVYSNGIREVVANTPLTNLMTETDGPVPFRKAPFNGQLTRPSFIREVVYAIAGIKKVPPEEVADQIIKNFEAFFNLKVT